jgi:hypothetical protein
MAALPIGIRDIITPYMVYGEEQAEIVQSANNRVYVSRGGGYRYRMTLNLRPFNILNKTHELGNSNSDAARFEYIRAKLTKYPQLDLPIINTIQNEIAGTAMVAYDDDHNRPGVYTVQVDNLSFTGRFQSGQYIKFGAPQGKEKVYQVEEYNYLTGVITLTQRLRQWVQTPARSIIYSEVDGLNIPFDGVMAGFVNEDFGHPVARIDDGIHGIIGPLSLIENI